MSVAKNVWEHGCIRNPYSDDGLYHNAWNLGWADARYVERLAANMKTIRINRQVQT